MKGKEDRKGGVEGVASQSDHSDLAALLRLKRYEQPPPAYFEDFLHEFHRRQRSEMLRVSPIRLWWERTQASWQGIQVGSMAYGGAAAVFAVIFGLMAVQSGSDPSGSSVGLAESGGAAMSGASVSLRTGAGQEGDTRWAKGSNGTALASSSSGTAMLGGDDFFDIREKLQAQQRAASATIPVYVLDSRPVSYEPPFSF